MHTFIRYVLLAAAFMSSMALHAATITVTDNGDSGAGTLRQAILDANAGDEIVFSGVTSIILLSALDPITDNNLTINGANAVTITGSSQSIAYGFAVNADGVTIKNLTLHTFTHGVQVLAGADNALMDGITLLNMSTRGFELFGANTHIKNSNIYRLSNTSGVSIRINSSATLTKIYPANLITTALDASNATTLRNSRTGIVVSALDGTTQIGDAISTESDRNRFVGFNTGLSCGSWTSVNTGMKIWGNHIQDCFFGIAVNDNNSGVTEIGKDDANYLDFANVFVKNSRGIYVQGKNTQIHGNFIGITKDESLYLTNGTPDSTKLSSLLNNIGILVAGSTNLNIGKANRPNYIANNTNGIQIQSTGVLISHNVIGTDPADRSGLKNIHGIWFEATGDNNTVQYNRISGNDVGFVSEYSSNQNFVGHTIKDNTFGFKANGNLLKNNSVDIQCYTSNSEIEDNIIAAAGYYCGIEPRAHNILIAGNTIGTNADGTLKTGASIGIRTNVQTGSTKSESMTIGTPAKPNKISGNTNTGIWVRGTNNAQIIHNEIGLFAHSQGYGIYVETNNTALNIGSAQPSGSFGNSIAGSTNDGIHIKDDATNNGITIVANTIGRYESGHPANYANSGCGIRVGTNASNVTIGGSNASMLSGNYIGRNTLDGIRIDGGENKGISIKGNTIGSTHHAGGGYALRLLGKDIQVGDIEGHLSNTIQNHSSGGIHILANGRNVLKGNSFANLSSRISIEGSNHRPAPELSEARAIQEQVVLKGYSTPGDVIDVYTGSTVSGIVGSTLLSTVTADANGEWYVVDETGSWSYTNTFFTAIATDASGNSSVFSADISASNLSSIQSQCQGILDAEEGNYHYSYSRQYDELGILQSASRAYFDDFGRPLQSQTLNVATNTVWVTTTLYDAKGMAVLTTLPAPAGVCFGYRTDILKNEAGQDYALTDFYQPITTANAAGEVNNPKPVGKADGSAGLLNAYYTATTSANPLISETRYPYVTMFASDISSYAKASAPGETHKMGSGKETSSITMPVANELDQYIQARAIIVSNSKAINSLKGMAAKTISRDANGKEAVSFTYAGNLVATARVGTQSNNVNHLFNLSNNGSNFSLVEETVPNFFDIHINAGQTAVCYGKNRYSTYYSNPSSPGYSTEYDGTYLKITNLSTGITVFQGESGSSGYTLSTPGYYKVHTYTPNEIISVTNNGYQTSTNLYGSVGVRYTDTYTDYTYYYYDDAGRLTATIAPEGVKKMYATPLSSTTTQEQLVSTYFATLNTYASNGQLLSTNSVDEGLSTYYYHPDGRLFASQDAEQKLAGRFSYVLYDEQYRPVESAEYDPALGTTGLTVRYRTMTEVELGTNPAQANESGLESVAAMTLANQRAMLQARSTDITTTTYDDALITTSTSAPFESGGGTSFIQTTMDLRGKVVKTENQHSSTYYGYDARHRSAWTAQQIKHFNGTNQHATKTIHYGYGSNNDLLTTTYQAGSSTEQYRHRYTYDATHRLTAVYTQLNSSTELLHAKYLYNVDGSLRRTELGDKLQGIDYLYTLHGQLKAINNADLSKDYGNDGATNGFAPDVFGQVLNYFSNDYTNSTVQAAMQLESLVTNNTAAPMYNGLITSTRWNTRGQEYGINKEHAYTFSYDEKYQLKDASYGYMERGTPAPNFTAHLFTPQTKYLTSLTYADAHGNINSLSRMDDNGATQAINYTYTANTNKLASTTHGTANRTYSYNAIGQMVARTSTLPNEQNQYIDYTTDGLTKAVYADAAKTQNIVRYEYDEAGMRIKKELANSTIYYIRDVNGYELAEYERANNTTTLKQLNVYGVNRLGQIDVNGTTATCIYELKDHLGNVRATIASTKKTNGEADILSWHDYDPTGKYLPGRNVQSAFGNQHGYQGDFAVLAPETGYNSFELREYDAEIGRWLSPDPYGQYHSPYVGMGNDWVNNVDLDGGYTAPEFWSGIAKASKNSGYKALSTGLAIGRGINSALNKQNAIAGPPNYFVPVAPTPATKKNLLWPGAPASKDAKADAVMHVHRFMETENSTIGTFKISKDGKKTDLKGYVMEPGGPSTTLSGKDKRIPAGHYRIVKHSSKKYPHAYRIESYEVPSWRGILIHKGRIPAHTTGCMLPGDGYGIDEISGFDKMTNELYEYLDGIFEANPDANVRLDIFDINYTPIVP